MAAIPALEALEDLPRTPASDVKKLGWRGVMDTVRREGRVAVTNHGRAEAVILPVDEYERLLGLLREVAEKDRVKLDELRRRYDETLASLREPGAGDKLRDLLRKPMELNGDVVAGDF